MMKKMTIIAQYIYDEEDLGHPIYKALLCFVIPIENNILIVPVCLLLECVHFDQL